MKRWRAILGNTGAVATLAVLLAAPFFLYGWFQNGVAALHLRIDPQYSGGEVARVIQRDGYQVVVRKPVPRRSPLQRVDPFVQMTWTPAARLPAQVSDEIDLDGDGRPDLLVSFDTAHLKLDVTPRTPGYRPVHTAGVVSFSELIARVNDGIVVRVPLR
jgi:hypothetical protein